MKNFKKNREGRDKAGFIQIVLVVVGALVLLRYIYKVDVIGFLTQGRFKELLDQLYSLGAQGWSKYSDLIIKVWNFFFDLVKNVVAKFK
jgi:hypothetical protein